MEGMSTMRKYKIGYTQGVFDMFHIGHLNLLRRAKEQCDYLIVGVNSDELVREYKKKETVVKQIDRVNIVSAIKYVDQCEVVDTLDKLKQLEKFQFEVIFIGSDWKDSPRWMKTMEDLEKKNVYVEFLEYTAGVCSTDLKDQEGVAEES
jgi:glycerol-3-phosphate cytidylyltransferase